MEESTTKKTSKKVFKIIKWILIIVLTPLTILGLIIFIGVVQIFYGANSTKIWLDLGNYEVVQYSSYYTPKAGEINICEKNDESKCMYGHVKGLKKDTKNNITYFYNVLYMSWRADNERYLINYGLGYFEADNAVDDNIPNFFIIKDGILSVYSKNTLQELPIEQQEILKDLEQNPRIIIDGKVEEWYK